MSYMDMIRETIKVNMTPRVVVDLYPILIAMSIYMLELSLSLFND